MNGWNNKLCFRSVDAAQVFYKIYVGFLRPLYEDKVDTCIPFRTI